MTITLASRRSVTFIDKHSAAKITGLSVETLKKCRFDGRLIEGIHWVAIGSRAVRFNQELLEDWVATRSCPAQHQRAIEAYLESLPSNQPKRRGRPSSDKNLKSR